MPDIRDTSIAIPEAELDTIVEPETPEAAEAFKADSSLAPKQRNEILDAWSKSQDEVGGLDPEEDPAKVAPEGKPAPKAAAKAKEEPEESEEPEAEPEAPKGKLTQAENREVMRARIALNQRFQRREQAQAARFAEREANVTRLEQQFSQQYAPLAEAAKAIEAGDFDGFAKGIGAYLKDPELSDWNKLNSAGLQAVQSPVYKKMRQLERAQAEQLEAQKTAQQRWQAQQAEAAKAAEITNWKSDLHDACVSHEDPAIAKLVESRPAIVDAIFNIQQSHYHSTGGDVLEPADAVAQLLENVTADFKFWSEFFESNSESPLLGAQAPKPVKNANRGATLERQTAKKTSGAAKPAAVRDAPAQAAAQRKLPSKSISQAQTSAPSQIGLKSDKDIKAHFERLIQQEWQAQG